MDLVREGIFFRAGQPTPYWDGVHEASVWQQGMQAHAGEKSCTAMAWQGEGGNGQTVMEEAAVVAARVVDHALA